MIEIIRTNENDPDFLELVELLDAELRVRDGAENGFYAQFNKPIGLCGAVVAIENSVPIGCGAFKKYDENTAEIKRMFVNPEARGKKVAARILTDLELWAEEFGFTECILETGYKQPEAIALYTRQGYEVIPNYGQYAGIENSVCMKKVIVNR